MNVERIRLTAVDGSGQYSYSSIAVQPRETGQSPETLLATYSCSFQHSEPLLPHCVALNAIYLTGELLAVTLERSDWE